MIEPVRPDAQGPARGGGAEEAMTGSVQDFTVRLERVFQGPLDLLLQLVRDKELEVHAVSLAEVCDAYCEHVRALEKVEVDEAADYLVVAATLLAIKSRSLLPQEELEADEDPFEPGEELVQQLLTYKELREVAEFLGECWHQRTRLLPAGGRWRGKQRDDGAETEPEWDLGEISLWDLLSVFRRLESETGFSRPHRVSHQGRPLRRYVEEVWDRLLQEPATTLRRLMPGKEVKREDVACYLVALLELAKQQTVDLVQPEPFSDIEVRRVAERDQLDLGVVEASFESAASDEEPEIDELLEGKDAV